MKFLYPRTHGARISDDLFFRDMRLITMENDFIRLTLIPEKGSDIVEFVDKRTGTDFMWANPQGLRSIKSEPNFHGHTEYFSAFYMGAWQELFPNGGGAAEVNGAKLPMHGEVASLPWKYAIVKDEPDEVKLTLRVRTVLSPFALEKTLTMNATDPAVRFDETVTNLGKETFPVMWGQHPAFGEPFLSEDCEIELPEGTPVNGDLAWCKVPPKHPRQPGHMWYHTGFDEGWYGIVNRKLDCGFGMKWDAKRFPVIWMWQAYGQEPIGGFPGHGRDYVVAIEPFNCYTQRFHDRIGRQPMEPGETWTTTFHAFAYRGAAKAASAKLKA